MPSRWLAISYSIVRALIRAVLFLVARTTVRGREHLPRDGPGVIVCNHINGTDPAVLVAVMPRPIALMSKVENYRGVLKLFMPMVGAFTVRRGTPDRQALRLAEGVLEQRRLLCLFPEGKRSRDGILGEAHGGAALLALKSGAPIIPVALTGTQHIFRRQFPWLGFPHITVMIGEPLILRVEGVRLQRAERERLTGEVMDRIAALLPPAQRGRYARGNPVQHRDPESLSEKAVASHLIRGEERVFEGEVPSNSPVSDNV